MVISGANSVCIGSDCSSSNVVIPVAVVIGSHAVIDSLWWLSSYQQNLLQQLASLSLPAAIITIMVIVITLTLVNTGTHCFQDHLIFFS
jgi:hypothetical protein